MTDRAARAWSTVYRARWVVPVTTPPIRDGAVAVRDGEIIWVGRAGDEPDAASARVVELGDAVLAPGLVNAHTHLDLTILNGLLAGDDFFSWVRTVVACRNEMTADERADSARLGVLQGFEAGVTTFADTAPGPESFDAMREMGARGIAFLEVFGPDAVQCESAIADLRDRLAALSPLETSRVTLGVSPHAPYSVSDALYRATADLARSTGRRLATHVAESADETALVAAGTGAFAAFLAGRGIEVAPRARSPVELLARAGVLGENSLLIHAVRCDANDVAVIAAAGAAVATCPRSNAYFGLPPAPVAAFRRAGVRTGVGSDSLASNTSIDLIAEVDAMPATTAAERWELVTYAGARALGLDDVIGALEPGLQADLAAFAIDVDAPDAPDAAWPRAGARATLVTVAGVERVRQGVLVGPPAAAAPGVRARAAAARARLSEWRRASAAS